MPTTSRPAIDWQNFSLLGLYGVSRASHTQSSMPHHDVFVRDGVADNKIVARSGGKPVHEAREDLPTGTEESLPLVATREKVTCL
ncbi:MAG: hypothetical protein ND895_16520 [Pyrinomonadaceae bacterium]|nr:hypothetical protein [Pyrinomonadaceae bacterium]